MVLSENRVVRLFVFFIFYVGQGLPIGLTSIAIPGWLAANGASDAAVASLVAVSYLAWSYKFVGAAIIDRYPYLPMGRRRLWLIGSHLLMLAGFGGAAWVGGSPEDVSAIAWLSFVVMTAGALQDVAVDGLAVDLLPQSEQGTASALMFGGQILGTAAAAALGGAMLQWSGASAAFLALMPLVLLVSLVSLVIRERPGEKRFPWSLGETHARNLGLHTDSWLAIFKVTLRALITVDSLGFITASALQRMAGGALTALYPLVATRIMGFDTLEYSGLIATMMLLVSFTCMGLGSLMSRTLGDRKSAIAVFLGFVGLYSFLRWGQPAWQVMTVFIGMTFVWQALDTLSSAVTNPLRMRLSDKRVAATQFTLYNSLSNLPVAFGASLMAWFGGLDGRFALLPLLIGFMAVAIGLFAVLPLSPVDSAGEAENEPVPRMA